MLQIGEHEFGLSMHDLSVESKIDTYLVILGDSVPTLIIISNVVDADRSRLGRMHTYGPKVLCV